MYSLGATLFALLMGRPPFPGRDALEVVRKVLESEAPILPGPAGAIVSQAMERDPARRYPSALAFLQDVGRAIAGRPLVAQPPSVTHRFRLLLRRRKGLVAGLVAAVAVAVTLSAMLWSQQVRWRGEVERERLATDREAAWRGAETAVHGLLEWAELRFRTQPPTEAERAPRREELRRAVGDRPRHPRILGALEARFDYLPGDFEGANRAFDRLVSAHPDDPHVPRHRAMARLVHALVMIPGPYLSLTAGGSPVVLPRRPSAELRQLADRIAADVRHLSVREGAEQLLRGIRAYLDERYSDAVSELEAAARQPCVSVSALEVLAYTWMARGDYARGLESLDRALEICPTWANTGSFRGTLHLGLGRTLAARPGELPRAHDAYRCAVKDLRLGRASGYLHASAAINEAAAEMSLAELEAALEGRNPVERFRQAPDLLDAVEVPDSEPEAALLRATRHRNLGGLLLILVQWQLRTLPPDELGPMSRRSISEFTRALELGPAELAPLYVYQGVARGLLAGLHERAEILPETMADFDAGTKLHPRSVKFRHQIAGSALQAGSRLQDVEMLRFGLGHASEGVSLAPSDPMSWLSRGELYGALGAFESNGLRAVELTELGVKDLGRAIELRDSAPARLRRSQLQSRLAQLAGTRSELWSSWLVRAREDASRACALDMDSAEARFQLGAVHRIQGNREGAKSCFLQARSLSSCTPELRARIDDRLRDMAQEE